MFKYIHTPDLTVHACLTPDSLYLGPQVYDLIGNKTKTFLHWNLRVRFNGEIEGGCFNDRNLQLIGPMIPKHFRDPSPLEIIRKRDRIAVTLCTIPVQKDGKLGWKTHIAEKREEHDAIQMQFGDDKLEFYLGENGEILWVMMESDAE